MKGLVNNEKRGPMCHMSYKVLVALSLCIGLTLLCRTEILSSFNKASDSLLTDNVCPILPLKAPESFIKDNSSALAILYDLEFRKKSIEKLSGAVQVDTVVFDSPPEVVDDPGYYEKFKKFHQYLEETFPSVYENLEVQKVNTYGLVFIWKGSNESLKPIMLAAHQDVVPVQQDSLDAWTYPPFEGHYDGKYLYGRGSSDCKNLLIAIMESLELLVSKDFKPTRTIIAAFGFDEESGGIVGAGHISKFLVDKYGNDSMYALIDEGAAFIMEPSSGVLIAAPLVSEKGYVNIEAQLRTPGGHSSAPPDHTSIGIASELVYLLENNPFEPLLTDKSPVLTYLQCVAANFGDKLPPPVKEAILKADFDPKSNKQVIEMLSQSRDTKYLVRTSQAVDIIKGGEKANALPEAVSISINHRIAMESSIKEVADRFIKYVKIVAHKHNLGVKFQNEVIIDDESKDGVFYVEIDKNFVEPTPAAPYNDTVWEYLAGASRHLMHDLINPDLPYEFLVAPMLMPANTDTRHYHSLTKNIFRYSPGLGETKNIHSIDEYIEFDYHLHLIAFFFEYLQTIDTSEADN